MCTQEIYTLFFPQGARPVPREPQHRGEDLQVVVGYCDTSTSWGKLNLLFGSNVFQISQKKFTIPVRKKNSCRQNLSSKSNISPRFVWIHFWARNKSNKNRGTKTIDKSKMLDVKLFIRPPSIVSSLSCNEDQMLNLTLCFAWISAIVVFCQTSSPPSAAPSWSPAAPASPPDLRQSSPAQTGTGKKNVVVAF